MLDANEYLHLAMNASEKDDHHAALNYLQQALTQEPDNAALVYFLAAEHAELGLFERACTGIARALELNDTMHMARFQLGLLQLQLQRLDDARQTFTTLQQHANENGLRQFAGAYIALLDNDNLAAARHLEQGLTDCHNPALKKDMSRVFESLVSEASSTVADKHTDEAAPVFLGAYRDSFETH